MPRVHRVLPQVPEAVRAEEGEFYQCGVCLQVFWCKHTRLHSSFSSRAQGSKNLPCAVCLQVFWPGAKYDATMDGLKQATLAEEGANGGSIPA